jgi:hypothetical protein
MNQEPVSNFSTSGIALAEQLLLYGRTDIWAQCNRWRSKQVWKQGTWSMEWQRDRQIDTQLLLAVQEASMSELTSTEIPITVRTFLWLLLIVSLSILVALDRHIKALVLNNRKHACKLGVLSTCTLLLYSDFCVYTCLSSLHFPDLLPLFITSFQVLHFMNFSLIQHLLWFHFLFWCPIWSTS